MDDELDDEYLELPKVDVVVPAPVETVPATTNGTGQSLEALCAQMEFTSVKHYLQKFYKV